MIKSEFSLQIDNGPWIKLSVPQTTFPLISKRRTEIKIKNHFLSFEILYPKRDNPKKTSMENRGPPKTKFSDPFPETILIC